MKNLINCPFDEMMIQQEPEVLARLPAGTESKPCPQDCGRI